MAYARRKWATHFRGRFYLIGLLLNSSLKDCQGSWARRWGTSPSTIYDILHMYMCMRRKPLNMPWIKHAKIRIKNTFDKCELPPPCPLGWSFELSWEAWNCWARYKQNMSKDKTLLSQKVILFCSEIAENCNSTRPIPRHLLRALKTRGADRNQNNPGLERG